MRAAAILLAAAGLALAGCATVGPKPGESPCAYGARLLDEARTAAAAACRLVPNAGR